jgi:hypothetical protein
MLIASAGVATAASIYWASVPQGHMSGAVAAIMSGYGHIAPARMSAARAAPPAAAPAHAPLPTAGETVASAVAQMTARDKLALLRLPLSPDSANDPFTVSSWLPPPAPPAPPPPAVRPAPPTAPPLPFGFVGQLDADAAKSQVFLSSGDRLLIVSPGDVIDGQYRLESIAATGVTFTYLPLNVKQVMSTQGEGK